jgi:hypothetical protein
MFLYRHIQVRPVEAHQQHESLTNIKNYVQADFIHKAEGRSPGLQVRLEQLVERFHRTAAFSQHHQSFALDCSPYTVPEGAEVDY